MKQAVKICFMAAVALLIPGIILCAAGSIAGGRWTDAISRNNVISGSKPLWGWSWTVREHDGWDWDWNDEDDESDHWSWSRGSGTSVAANDSVLAPSGSDSGQALHRTGEIRKLDFTVQVGHLELTLGDDFSVNADGCDGVQVDSTKEDGVWKLKVWSDHNHSHNHDSDDIVEVVLPRDAWYDAIDLECSAGAITGEELACGTLEVDVQAGSVQLRRMQTESMDLSADAGSVDVSGTVTELAAIEVNAGSVTLRTPKPEQYGYSVECNMGSVDLFGDVSTALYNRNVQNQDARPFYDLEVNTGKAVVLADDTL